MDTQMLESIGEQQVSTEPTDQWAWQHGTSRLPAAAEVVIIGGGIVGCTAAWVLARRGVSVVLCEKGRIAGEQSGRNWGWVRQQGRSALELPLMIESLRLWQSFREEFGEDVGFTQGGCLYLAQNERELEEHAAWLPVAREFGLDTRLLTARELATLLQSNGARWAGALYTASDGRAEPARVTPALARAAERAGAQIFTRCAVRGIECIASRAHAVITEHGRITATAIICAAGAWTSLFCRSLGIAVPQLRVKGTVARTAPAPKILDGAAFSAQVAIRRRCDGGYTVAHGSALEHALAPSTLRFARKFLPALRQESGAIRLRFGREFFEELVMPRRWAMTQASPFERQRILAPAPSRKILGEIQQRLRGCFPEIAEVPVVETWGGMIEASPDVLPIISATRQLEGFFIATGFSGHGFGIGPAAGRLVADLATGEASAAELAPFRLERFYDGSPIRPGPAI
jgi:glycine/D-amino acid oxidase-like deaminating enzyme